MIFFVFKNHEKRDISSKKQESVTNRERGISHPKVVMMTHMRTEKLTVASCHLHDGVHWLLNADDHYGCSNDGMHEFDVIKLDRHDGADDTSNGQEQTGHLQTENN